MTLGSSGATRMPVHAPLGTPPPLHDNLWIYRIDRNTALYGAAISNGGLMLDWTLELLNDPEGNAPRRMPPRSPPASHGLSILPFLSAERSPIWNDRARGVISGLSLATTRADAAARRHRSSRLSPRRNLRRHPRHRAQRRRHHCQRRGPAEIRSAACKSSPTPSMRRSSRSTNHSNRPPVARPSWRSRISIPSHRPLRSRRRRSRVDYPIPPASRAMRRSAPGRTRCSPSSNDPIRPGMPRRRCCFLTSTTAEPL